MSLIKGKPINFQLDDLSEESELLHSHEQFSRSRSQPSPAEEHGEGKEQKSRDEMERELFHDYFESLVMGKYRF